MQLKHIAAIIIGVYFLLAGTRIDAQSPDFSEHTLNFRDLTLEHVNQTIVEIPNNEKDIDFGDYDNDGDLDVVVSVVRSDFGQRRNKLYRNENGVLNEVSGAPVIPGFSNLDASRRALMRDFDRDGFLDIIIVNDSLSGTGTIDSPGRIKLYRNIDGQTFSYVTEQLNHPSGSAASGVAEDFDQNGYCDLMLCNHPNISQDSLALNDVNERNPGHFQTVTNTHMPTEMGFGKHVEAADMNGDGQLDLLVTNSASAPSFIYYNNNEGAGSGPGDFRYDGIGSSTLLAGTPSGLDERAMAPGDFNGDGRTDFYFAIAGGVGASLSDAVFMNIGNDDDNRAVFHSQAISSNVDDETNKVTVNDLDGDGRPDVIVMSELRRPFIFRNTSENGEVSFIEWTPAVFTTDHSG